MAQSSLQSILRSTVSAFYFFVLAITVFALSNSQSLRADESPLFEAAPLSFPPEQLRAWVEEKATQQPRTKAVANVDDQDKPTLVRLLVESRYHFASDGSVQVTTWEITKVLDKEGAGPASRVDAVWEPWHKDRPTIEARVINSDGSVFTNDGKDAVEQPVDYGQPGVMTDARQLTLMLHAVEKGSIVETKISVRERTEANAWFQRAMLTEYYPAKIHRLVITHDKDVQVVHRCLGPELNPQIAERAGLSSSASPNTPLPSIAYQVDLPLPVFELVESGCGPDRSSLPLIEFGIPQPWTDLARHYSEAVEKAIGEGNKFGASLVKNVAESSKTWTTQQKVEWCEGQIHKALRYTSLAFGEQHIYPVSPDKVFARRFGDCKDYATLLVAMLRELGVTSHVALLYASQGIDVPREKGALGLFNHAITYIPEINLWVDLTAEDYPVGLLPATDYGRRALICSTEDGRILKTPSLSAAKNQSHEFRSYDLNFSGGGHITVGISGQGLYGLDLRSGYKDAAPDKLVDSWKTFFKDNYGLPVVRSLQRCEFGPANYAVRAASSSDQLCDRDAFEFSTRIDGRNLLEELPLALQYKDFDKAGKPENIPHRVHPLVLSQGLRSLVTYSLLYPGGLTVTTNAKSWKQKFGTVELSITLSQNDISNQVGALRNPQMKWDELVPESKEPAYQWTSPCDRELRIQLELLIEPGELTVDEANRCIDFINSLKGEDGQLVCSAKWNWTAMEELQSKPNSDALKELARQAKVYNSFVIPRLALANELRLLHFHRFAHTLAADIKEPPQADSLARPWLTALRSTDINGVPLSPLLDLQALRDLNRNHEMTLAAPVRYIALHCALTDANCLRTFDKKDLEYARDLFEAHRKESANTARALEEDKLIIGDQTYILLALHEDEVLKQLFRQREFGRFNPIESMLLEKDLNVPKAYTVRQRSEIKRIYWESLINCGRADLAHRLDRLWSDAKLELATEDDTQPTLAPLDRKKAESVAQHAILAMLAYEPAALKEMLANKKNLEYFLHEPTYAPIEFEEWFTVQRTSRSRAILEAIIQLTPMESKPVGQKGKIVTFNNPYSMDPYSLWMTQEPDGKWYVSPFHPYLFAHRLLDYVQAGESQEAGEWLEVIMPPLVKALPWFDNTRGSPAAHAWKLKDDKRRVELTINLLLAEGGEVKPIEKWLSENKEPLPDYLDKRIGDVLAAKARVAGKFAPSLERALKAAEEAKTVESLRLVLQFAERMRVHSHEPFDLTRIRTLKENTRLPKNADPVAKKIEVDFAFLSNEPDKAFELLEQMVDAQHVDAHTLNTYLWSSMVNNVATEVLTKRLDKALKHQPVDATENHFYLHTRACAQAMCGDPYRAAQALREIAHRRPDAADELLRGLILEQLEMPEAAKSSFELCMELEPYTDSALIAKQRLSRLRSKE